MNGQEFYNMEPLTPDDIKAMYVKVESLEALVSSLIDILHSYIGDAKFEKETTEEWFDYQSSLKHQ